MKKFKNLCFVSALGIMVTGVGFFPISPVHAAENITVEAGGTSLADALASAQTGDTITVKGTIESGAVSVPAGITLIGDKDAKIDFSSTTGSSGRGVTVNTNGSTIKNLEICNASDNGIYMEGSYNQLINLKVHNNKDSGVQLSNGAAYNEITNVYSYSNADATGENADGFAIKLHSGEGNRLSKCVSEGNSDDGYDLYAAHGAVTFIKCRAINNGDCNGIKGNGNGFKLGGVDNKTPGVPAHLDPLNHVLVECVASGNTANGFDRNNQNGVITMTRCTSESNGKHNYNFPLKGTPSALGYEVTFANAVMTKCKSINGTNDISGATLTKCEGF